MRLPTLKPNQKKQLNKFKINLAKFVAYSVLILSSAYGFRSALETAQMQESAQYFITVLLTLGLVFVITLKDE